MELAGAECGMRALSLAFAAMAALLVGLDKETETVIFVKRTATVRDLTALWAMTIIVSVTAGYQLLQLCRCMALGRSSSALQSKLAAWLRFLLDQGAAYGTFLATMAGLQGSLVGVFGVHKLQWMKVCNVYGRFCKEIAGGVLCGLVATSAMAIVAAISAYHLFRLYSRVHRDAVRYLKT